MKSYKPQRRALCETLPDNCGVGITGQTGRRSGGAIGELVHVLRTYD